MAPAVQQLLGMACLVWAGVAQAQAYEVGLVLRQDMERGLLEKAYWETRLLGQTNHSVLAYVDQAAYVQIPIGRKWGVLVERRDQATLKTNEASLIAAAQGSSPTDSDQVGRYGLQGHLKRYAYDAVGLSLPWEQGSWQLTLKPKWLKLKTFRNSSGEGVLSFDAVGQALMGQVHQETDRSTGFLINPKPLDLGQGYSLDLNAHWKTSHHVVEWEVLNAVSEVSINQAFYASNTYQVTANQSGLVFSDLPSLVGTYGQSAMKNKLPRMAFFDWTYTLTPNWLPSLGVVALPGGYMTRVGLSGKFGNHLIKLSTYHFDHFTLAFQTVDFLTAGLAWGVQLTSGHKEIGSLVGGHLKYAF